MRVNITGLTDMTISFSGIGLILRGKTTARSIVSNNSDRKDSKSLNNVVSNNVLQPNQRRGNQQVEQCKNDTANSTHGRRNAKQPASEQRRSTTPK